MNYERFFLLLLFRKKRCFHRVPVAPGNILQAHPQDFMRDAVLIIQICIQHFRVIRIDRDFHAQVEQPL